MSSSTNSSEDSRIVIGELRKKNPDGETERVHSIHLGEELILGRDIDTCQVHFFDPTVSNKHLKIYSIVYDKSSDVEIKPLVYAEDISSNGSYWNGSLIGEGQGAVLLSDFDELRISPRISLVFRSYIRNDADETDPIQQAEKNYFSNEYRITTRKLGSGAHGRVNMAIKESTRRQLACKVVDLRKVREHETKKFQTLNEIRNKEKDGPRTSQILARVLSDGQRRAVEAHTSKLAREVELLKDLSHPNIVRLEKVFQTNDTLYIFEELVTGGDLFSYLENKGGHLDEAQTGVITLQITEALNYLHENDIVHRDLKPENILIAALAKIVRIVLTDFGNAIKITSKSADRLRRMQTIAGTRDYVAPEVHGLNISVQQRGYTKAVDMWSLGCVTTAMLTGSSPFSFTWREKGDRRSSSELIIEAASVCRLDGLEEAQEWKQISHRPRDFVMKLLVLDEKARLTAKHALNHDWFTNELVKDDFQAIYKKATAGWKKQTLPAETVEYIPDFSTPPKPLVAVKRKTKNQKPIEPHYQPSHRRLGQILAPRLPYPTLPIDKATEGWEQLMKDATRQREVDASQMQTFNAMGKLHVTQTATQDTSFPATQSRTIDNLEEERNPCNDLSYNNRKLLGSPFPDAALSLLGSRKESPNPINTKKKDIFDIIEDSDEEETAPVKHRDAEQYSNQDTAITTASTSFTPINQRQSVKLGSNILGKRDTNSLLNNDSTGHDGPLISKKRKLPIPTTPLCLLPSRVIAPDESPSRRAALKVRRALGVATSNARQSGIDSIEGNSSGGLLGNLRHKGGGSREKEEGEVQRPADLTDSIRTAYE